MKRAPRNRTITLSREERRRYAGGSIKLESPVDVGALTNRVINQDLEQASACLPDAFVDLMFLDPPYNQNKTWNGASFRRRSTADYARWLDDRLGKLIRTLKPSATVYICGDWRSSAAIHEVAEKHLIVRNRVTWERDKGRGARTNWKNGSEDIWFCTVSNDYFFDVDAVKLRRRVVAPYKDVDGSPKDWRESERGGYRDTHPSNLWTDLTVPFWSMPENTDHPTQKPEKLLAKLILASSRPGDMVFDPFLGSGTSAVVAKKLGRTYLGVEIDDTYCCLALKRLELANTDKAIQGFADGVFWDRNSQSAQKRASKSSSAQ